MKAYLQLIRLPNVFTVVSEIMMAYLVVHPGLVPFSGFVLLLASSVCLYWAGMVLNDLFDVQKDREERPDRPIPSGRVPLTHANLLGWGLLIIGVALGGAAGFVTGAELPWRSGVMALIVAVSVVAYDGVFKSTLLGPVFMGLCRWGNVLLGMSTGPVISDYATRVFGFDAMQLAIAGGIGVYITGVTFFARNEAGIGGGDKGGWWGGAIVMVLGLVWLGSMTHVSVALAGRYDLTMPHSLWPLAVAAVSVTTLRRVFLFLLNPDPRSIQLAVKGCIISLIVFHAAVCMATRSPWWWSVLLLGLTIPMHVLGRYFYST